MLKFNGEKFGIETGMN